LLYFIFFSVGQNINIIYSIRKEMFEDTKGVIRSRKSNKDRQYNDHNINDRKTNNGPQNTTQKTNWATQIPTKNTWDEIRCSGRMRCNANVTIPLYGTWKCYIISRRWNCHISITSHPSGAPDFIPGIFGGDLCCSISFLCSILWTIVCLSVIYIMVIVLSVLVWFTTSDYPT
jgi:hypothetical protein